MALVEAATTSRKEPEESILSPKSEETEFRPLVACIAGILDTRSAEVRTEILVIFIWQDNDAHGKR